MLLGLPRWLSRKASTCNAGAAGDVGSIPGSGRSPGRGILGIPPPDPLEEDMATTPVLLPGESHGQSPSGYSPRSRKESGMTEAT